MAVQEELESLHKNGTWRLVTPPIENRIVGCKWVYKKKEGLKNEGTKYRAMLVAKGYSQVEGVDFYDVFFLVVKYTSIRVLLALFAMNGLEL